MTARQLCAAFRVADAGTVMSGLRPQQYMAAAPMCSYSTLPNQNGASAFLSSYDRIARTAFHLTPPEYVEKYIRSNGPPIAALGGPSASFERSSALGWTLAASWCQAGHCYQLSFTDERTPSAGPKPSLAAVVAVAKQVSTRLPQ